MKAGNTQARYQPTVTRLGIQAWHGQPKRKVKVGRLYKGYKASIQVAGLIGEVTTPCHTYHNTCTGRERRSGLPARPKHLLRIVKVGNLRSPSQVIIEDQNQESSSFQNFRRSRWSPGHRLPSRVDTFWDLFCVSWLLASIFTEYGPAKP